MQVQQAVHSLCERGLQRLDAQMLVLHTLHKPTTERAWLLAHSADEVLPDAQQRLEAFAARRLDGEPLAFITGHKEFYGLDLRVDARVLDPRADTETLVDWALELMPGHAVRRAPEPPGLESSMQSGGSVIDLGTGSGAIALALQQQRPHWQVHALDFSQDALDVARANAARLQLPVTFHQGAWLQGVGETFDLIVSNPPYIAAHDHHLAALRHEPLQALASGTDGLDDIRTIISQAPRCLKNSVERGGWLLLEHGYDQAEAVRALLSAAGFAGVQSRRDLAGIERCSGGRWQHPLPQSRP